MPNLPTHIHFAIEAGSYIESDSIESNFSAYLVGSTTPDMRAITKKDRSVYHFVNLDFKGIGEGLSNLVTSHPKWSNLANVDNETRAFMAGYASHLILDETWVTLMFRPYFQDSKLFPDPAKALVMDRAMQLGLDKFNWMSMKPYLSDMQDYRLGVDVDFLESEPVEDWKNWIFRLLGADFTWERLLFMATRISRGDETHPAIRYANEFIANPEEMFDDLIHTLPEGVLNEFENAAVSNIQKHVNRFIE